MPRTDNDTWDLSTSVGATATMVAAARAIATRAEHPLINDPFALPLVRAVGVDFFTRWASGEFDGLDADNTAGWGLHRMPDAMAARTAYFDAFFADATAAGIRQAVILASGLDARGYRLSWPPEMTVFEIDQPEVIEFKKATLADLGAQPSADLRSVPIDLRQDWPAALLHAGFHADRPTAWLAEGLLGFLPPEAQDRLLDHVTALSADGSRLATESFTNTTSVDPDQREQSMRNVTERWREHGFDVEIWDLGYHGERNDVGAYLHGAGWRATGTTMKDLLAAYGLPPVPQHDDEVSFADSWYHTAILTK
jgi:methyltransferase (TIGR00027 family)